MMKHSPKVQPNLPNHAATPSNYFGTCEHGKNQESGKTCAQHIDTHVTESCGRPYHTGTYVTAKVIPNLDVSPQHTLSPLKRRCLTTLLHQDNSERHPTTYKYFHVGPPPLGKPWPLMDAKSITTTTFPYCGRNHPPSWLLWPRPQTAFPDCSTQDAYNSDGWHSCQSCLAGMLIIRCFRNKEVIKNHWCHLPPLH